ncbi:olfactory receptor 14J1-like, partial [Melospiza melodia melodia]|uniref:olfactory receptor 14J1-like n=1 Tax=Melospiza melodia melodia TaxID=1914991 RepID=UPI002FD72798
LHYRTLLGSRACAHMAAAAWGSAFLNALLHTANTFSLPLCHGNALGQFFCEIPQILKLSCSQSNLRELGLIVVSLCLSFGCFVFIVFSYVQIFRAVLRIPSEQGRHKAFSTCLPHLAVVSLFISTGTFAHLKPPSISSPSLDISVSVLYSVVPPSKLLWARAIGQMDAAKHFENTGRRNVTALKGLEVGNLAAVQRIGANPRGAEKLVESILTALGRGKGYWSSGRR